MKGANCYFRDDKLKDDSFSQSSSDEEFDQGKPNTSKKDKKKLKQMKKQQEEKQQQLEQEMEEDENYVQFENSNETKHIFSQYLLVRNFLGFIIIVNIFLSLMIYEYIAIDPSNFPWPAQLLSISTTVVQAGVIFVWIKSLIVMTALKKEKQLLGNETFIQDLGTQNFIIALILLIFHPIFFLIDVPFFINENYYKQDTTFDSYQRPIVEYLILIQFVVGILLVLKIFLENLKYGNNRADRIARFFGIEADSVFVLRACMKRYPLQFVIFLEIFGILFFGVLVRIAETNYVQHIPSNLTKEEHANEFSNRILFFNYANVFWNMIITMTTIGYGDFYTRSTLARFFIIITGFYGILVTSLLVVAFTNLLEMESSEDIAFNIIKSLDVQSRKDAAAITLTSDILRGGTLDQDKKPGSKKTDFKKQIALNLKNYIDIKQEYRSMNMDKTEFLTSKAFKIYSMLSRWNIKSTLEEKQKSNFEQDLNEEKYEQQIFQQINFSQNLI